MEGCILENRVVRLTSAGNLIKHVGRCSVFNSYLCRFDADRFHTTRPDASPPLLTLTKTFSTKTIEPVETNVFLNLHNLDVIDSQCLLLGEVDKKSNTKLLPLTH